MTLSARTVRNFAKALVATFIFALFASVNTTPANAFAGTLENGNLAYADSAFNKGAACNYLPGFETGYDAWHWILTTRGATFQQDPRDPTVAINLNIVYMRQDGSLFVIKSGAWVQTGKGAYTYTRVSDRIRLVQAGSLALINGSDSGMRLSHTCPGSGSVTTTATPTPTPTATTSASAIPTASASPSASASTSATPSPSASPTSSPSALPSVSPLPSATTAATPTPSSTVIPSLAPRPSARASAVQIRPTSRPNALPTPTPSAQAIGSPSPTPSPSSTSTVRPTPTPSPTSTSQTTPAPAPSVPNQPVVLPTPPAVEDPKNVEYVEPAKPREIDPTTFTDPPASTVEVTKEPTYGDLTTNNDGTFTYTPPAQAPAVPVVDVVEFKYTNLSGEAVIVRKEFVMTVKGDVPSIIQTGSVDLQNATNLLFALIVVLTLLVSWRFGRKVTEN